MLPLAGSKELIERKLGLLHTQLPFSLRSCLGCRTLSSRIHRIDCPHGVHGVHRTSFALSRGCSHGRLQERGCRLAAKRCWRLSIREQQARGIPSRLAARCWLVFGGCASASMPSACTGLRSHCCSPKTNDVEWSARGGLIESCGKFDDTWPAAGRKVEEPSAPRCL